MLRIERIRMSGSGNGEDLLFFVGTVLLPSFSIQLTRELSNEGDI